MYIIVHYLELYVFVKVHLRILYYNLATIDNINIKLNSFVKVGVLEAIILCVCPRA